MDFEGGTMIFLVFSKISQNIHIGFESAPLFDKCDYTHVCLYLGIPLDVIVLSIGTVFFFFYPTILGYWSRSATLTQKTHPWACM